MSEQQAGERGELSTRLVEYRRQARLSQRALGKLAGVSQGTIRDLETGKQRRPHLDTLRLLARGLATNANGQYDRDEASILYSYLVETVDPDPLPDTQDRVALNAWLGRQDRFDLQLESEKKKVDDEYKEAYRLTDSILDVMADDRTATPDRDFLLGILRSLAARFPPIPDEPLPELPPEDDQVLDDETEAGLY